MTRMTSEIVVVSEATRRRPSSSRVCMPWAIAIARNVLIDHIRTIERHMRVVALQGEETVEPSFEEHVHAKRLASVIEREVSKLPEPQREAFRLTAQGQVSLAQAARLLRTTKSALKLRTHRARLSLKAAIRRHSM